MIFFISFLFIRNSIYILYKRKRPILGSMHFTILSKKNRGFSLCLANRCTEAGTSPATDTQVKFLLAGGTSCWQFVLNCLANWWPASSRY